MQQSTFYVKLKSAQFIYTSSIVKAWFSSPYHKIITYMFPPSNGSVMADQPSLAPNNSGRDERFLSGEVSKFVATL